MPVSAQLAGSKLVRNARERAQGEKVTMRDDLCQFESL